MRKKETKPVHLPNKSQYTKGTVHISPFHKPQAYTLGDSIHDNIGLSLFQLSLFLVVVLFDLLEGLAGAKYTLVNVRWMYFLCLEILTSSLLSQHIGEYPCPRQVAGASLSAIFLPARYQLSLQNRSNCDCSSKYESESKIWFEHTLERYSRAKLQSAYHWNQFTEWLDDIVACFLNGHAAGLILVFWTCICLVWVRRGGRRSRG